MRSRLSLRSVISKLLFALACLLAATIVLIPLFVLVTTALKNQYDVLSIPATLIPRPFVWSNLVDAWHFLPSVSLARMFLNSIVISTGATLLTMLLAVPSAYAMAKAEFAAKQVMSLVLLALQMFSAVVIILPLYKFLLRLGLINTHAGVILVDAIFLSSFATWLLVGFFQAVPEDLEKAAVMDGCSSWQVITRIFLPLAAPGLVVTAVYCFIGAWNEFFFAYTLLASDRLGPLMVGIYRQRGASSYELAPHWEMLMTMSMFSVIPPALLFMMIRRHLVGGLATGATKG